ncbi:YL1-domain-containing protein [Schizopora paradoxa]|uniref:YL1-domain-containing protein n=1 Tax=Schizopora paradoxa TaxID=27342 RepID=A0A0H2S0Z4_9AGAM|nr:YL1-domain-containing protein [Schizopora paradoxa]
MEEQPEDGLTLRRSRRSTAGNRMEEALLQFAMEEQNQEGEEDADFVGPEDEAEIFDSDFQSTDDEAQQEEEAGGEKAIHEEEKREQRTVRQRAAKVAAAAITRQRIGVKEPRPKAISKLKNRRVSLGGAVDAETGEAVESRANRKSRRKSTVLAGQNLRNRLKDAEVKRASMPKRVREVTQVLSQAELIARALDNEESNIDEHRNYLAQEEEKRKRARVVRKSVSGPLMRWISRVEQEKVPPEPTSYPMSGILFAGHEPTQYMASSFALGQAGPSNINGALQSNNYLGASSSSTLQATTPFPAHPAPVTERTEAVSKCYVIIEKDQKEGVDLPQWDETMTTLFGDHVKWDEVKVFSGKHRPLSRPIARCPLTGRSASYRDPRSGVPFANVRAYRTLTRLLNHEYAWHDGLGCYTADTAYMDVS